MTILVAASAAFFLPRIYSLACDRCSEMQESPVQHLTNFSKILARFVHSSRLYWNYSKQYFPLHFWHVSLYDSLGWSLLIIFYGTSMTPYPFFIKLLLSLASSVVIEIIRKAAEHLVRVPNCFTTHDLETEHPLGQLAGVQTECSEVSSLRRSLLYERFLNSLNFSFINARLRRIEQQGQTAAAEGGQQTESSREVPVVVVGAAILALCLVIVDIFGMLYFPFAFTYGLYPLNFCNQQADSAQPPELGRFADRLEQMNIANLGGSHAVCPISCEEIVHPCRPKACSHVFEQSYILQWVELADRRGLTPLCPCCNSPIEPGLNPAFIDDQREICLSRHARYAAEYAASHHPQPYAPEPSAP